MGDRLILEIPSDWWMSSNSRMHWAPKARRTDWLRSFARLQAKAQHLDRCRGPVLVTCWVQFPTRGRADPANAYPVVKAIIDGLTDAHIWPDDDSEHVIGPDMRRKPGAAGKGKHIVELVLTDQYVPF